MFCIQLLAHFLALLRRTTGEIGAQGHRRVAFRDLVHRILEIPPQIRGLFDGLLMHLGQRLSLPLQFHNLPLVVAADHRDATLQVLGQIAEVHVRFRRCRPGSR